MTQVPTTDTIKTDRAQDLIAGATHLAAMLMALSTGWAAGAGGMLVGLLAWLLARNRYPRVARHAAEVFNFNLAMSALVKPPHTENLEANHLPPETSPWLSTP